MSPTWLHFIFNRTEQNICFIHFKRSLKVDTKHVQHMMALTNSSNNWAASRQNQHSAFVNQHGSIPACASAQSDQDPCCLLTNSITSRETNSEQHGSWLNCADAQAGLDPCWSQTHYVGFVMTRLNYNRSFGKNGLGSQPFVNVYFINFIFFN
jgi:hypothetical protein